MVLRLRLRYESNLARWSVRSRIRNLRMYTKGTLVASNPNSPSIQQERKARERKMRAVIKMPDLTIEPGVPNPFEHVDSIDWNPSEKIKMMSSSFIGHHIRIYTPKQAEQAVALFKYQHRELLKDATHGSIFAWRTGKPVLEGNQSEISIRTEIVSKKQKKKNKKDKKKEHQKPQQLKDQLHQQSPIEPVFSDIRQGVYDCGERGSGEDLMRRCIMRYNLYNVLIVVVRWKKGGDLGPSRFKCIGEAGTSSLIKGGLVKLGH